MGRVQERVEDGKEEVWMGKTEEEKGGDARRSENWRGEAWEDGSADRRVREGWLDMACLLETGLQAEG